MTETYDPNGAKDKKDFVMTYKSKTLYDTVGHKVTEHDTSLSSRACYTKIWKYNARGQIVSDILYGDEGSFGDTKEYSYDDRGRLLRMARYANKKGVRIDRLQTAVKYEYDSKGNTIEYDVTETMTYDSYGYITKKIYYETNNYGKTHDTITTLYHYDERCRMTEKVELGGLYPHRNTYTYDDRDSLAEEQEIYPNGETTIYKKKYDEHGNEVESICTPSCEGGPVWRHTYQYDKMGNWIYMDDYEHTTDLMRYYVRRIEYY